MQILSQYPLKLKIIIPIIFSIGILVGISSVQAQENDLIPSWIKSTAQFWINGDVNDQEFIKILQYLVNEGIIVIPEDETKITTQSNPNDDYPLDIEIIGCDPKGTSFVEHRIKIINNGNNAVKLKINYLGMDIDGNPVTFETYWTDIVSPNSSIFEKAILDDSPELDTCSVSIQDVEFLD